MIAKLKNISTIKYSLFLITVSVLMTVLFYHLFVFNTFSRNENQTLPLREISTAEIKNSPIREDNSIIEVLSYGCHYCAINEENLAEFTKKLPRGSTFKTIHITSDANGLAAYAPVFATLEEMGIEKKVRDGAYNAIITYGIDLSDDKSLETWLLKNGIDVEKYKSIRNSAAVKARLNYMAAITQFYHIDATPMFIINKRYIVAQDGSFPEFASRMLQLLEEDK
ncbi:DsbA family protein [Citrobacter koseri]|uniref:DsbA family protein n=1 Tax=Citrobacter koseri TaxID=545 RepID=UPI0006693073|nr:DsbA family protein [Citrobacter koseri]HEM6801132.1 DsbA family protein [Citrobacter koseri]